LLWALPEEGIEWITRAMHLNPFHPPSYWNDLSAAYYDARQYQEAVTTIMQMPQPFRRHDVARAQLGDLTRARKHADAVLRRWPDFSSRRFLSGEPYKNEADLAHNLDGLLKAGLPE
jgi:adenylate cyclase